MHVNVLDVRGDGIGSLDSSTPRADGRRVLRCWWELQLIDGDSVQQYAYASCSIARYLTRRRQNVFLLKGGVADLC